MSAYPPKADIIRAFMSTRLSVSTPVPRRHCNVAEDERIHRLSFRRGDGEARQRSPDIDAQTYRFCARWTAFALPGYRDYSAR
jgi:hypothetical protein